jgi:hypothetical protein
LLDQSAEQLPHGGQIGDLLLDQRQLAGRQCSRFGTGARLFQPQQSRDFGQRESQHLGPA